MTDVHMPVDLDNIRTGILQASLRHIKLAYFLIKQEETTPYLKDEHLAKLWIPLCLMVPSLARRLLFEEEKPELRDVLCDMCELHPFINLVFEPGKGTAESYWREAVRAGDVDALTLRLQHLWDEFVTRAMAE